MMAKKIWTFDGAKASPWHVLETANAYYELSTPFTDWVHAVAYSGEFDMHKSVASATNRILALELYIKALLVAIPATVPKVHDLVVLFEALPEVMRNALSERFDQGCKLGGPVMSVSVESSFQLTHVEEELQVAESSPKHDPSLIALLERNRDGFVDSRYLFAEAKFDKVETYNYEFPRLAMACLVLCEVLERDLGKHPSTYKRTFNFFPD
jgi:hypothetical protein